MEAAKPTSTPWAGVDHVQLAIPAGGEALARRFWLDRLGFDEEPKPPALAARGGAWFRAGATRVHVGVDPSFTPARKAHPGLLVRGLRALVEDHALVVVWDDEIPGVDRCYVDDPFGNRIELVEAGE